MGASRLLLRVFLSSPDDVWEERRIAREVIETLEANHLLRDKIHFDIVAWDDAHAAVPMDAHDTPQASVNRYAGRPADCDLTLVILWSRLGTLLPPDVIRPDGSRYPSGTVWEYDDALAASKPVFVYRRSAKPQIDVDDPDVESKREQFEAVKRFFSGFTNADGSLKAGFTSYKNPEQFSTLLRQHLEAFVNERLSGREVITLPAVAQDDPRVVQILALVDELGRKNRELDEKNAEIERLIREITDLRRAAIARTLTAAAQADAKDAATAAAEALRAGDTHLAENLLREEERADAAHLGQGDADDAAVRRQLAALAREQGALAMGHNVGAALAAFHRAAEYQPDDTWTHFVVGDLHARLGTLDAAMRSYRTGAGNAEERLRLMPDDPDAQLDFAVSQGKMGDVLVAQGDGPGGLAAYRASMEILEALAARDPANIRRQHNLSVNHDRIGDVLVAQGDEPGGLAAYRTALAIRAAIATRDPANTVWQRDLAVSQSKIGAVLLAQGDVPGALAAYRAALAIREALVARDPANTMCQRDLAVSQSKMGSVLVAQGDGPGALAAHHAALGILEALAARDPANTAWQRDLAVHHEWIGDALVAQRDEPGALAAHRTALAIRAAIVTRDPTNTLWQRDLAMSQSKMASVLVAQGDGPGALAAYRTALAIREALVARDPANIVWRRDLWVSQSRLGDVLVAQGDEPGGLAAYRAALAIGEALAVRDPTNSQWLVDVAASCLKLGSLAREHTTDMRRVYLTRGREILVKLKTAGFLRPHHDWINLFNEQIEQLVEEDGQATPSVINEPLS